VRRPAVLLSRLDAEQWVVELPPMRRDRAASAIRFRVASLHPRASESLKIDFVPNGRKPGSYLVFAAEASVIAAAGAKADGLPILSPTLLAAELSPAGPWSCLFWDARWASLDHFLDGVLVETRRIMRGGDAPRDLRKLVGTAGIEGPVDGVAVDGEVAGRGTGSAGGEPDASLAELGAAFAEVGVKPGRLCRLEDLLPRVRAGRAAVFPRSPRSRSLRRRALAALVGFDLLLALALAARIQGSLDRELEETRKLYLGLQREHGGALRLADEAAAAERRYAELAAARTPDMYYLVEAVAANVGPGAGIRSLVVSEGEFRAEAEGPSALSCLSALESSGAFASVRLGQAQPSPGGAERFSLSGRFASAAGRPGR